jgi:hypothetical protein
MQKDGNLVIYNDSHKSIWASGTMSTGATYLALGSDGNLGVYKPDGSPVWTSIQHNQHINY